MSYFFQRDQISFRDETRVKEKMYVQKLVLDLESELEIVSEVKRPETLSNWYISKSKRPCS